MTTKTAEAASAANVETIDDLLSDQYPPEPAPEPWEPTPGHLFHALRGGLPIPVGHGTTTQRAQTYEITPSLIEDSKDRFGSSWLDLIDNEAAQIDRWGSRYLAPGPAPAGMSTWEPGTPEHWEAREQARREAWAITSTRERIAALKSVEDLFGPAPTTSRTTNEWRPGHHPTERMAAEQQARFAAGRREGTR